MPQMLMASPYSGASEDSYSDLFWALRGGDAGTFGVVTSVIIKAFPDTDTTLSTFVLGNSTDGSQLVSREDFFKAVRVFWESFPAYTAANTYSFFFIFKTNGQLILDMKAFHAPGKPISRILTDTQNLANTQFINRSHHGIFRQSDEALL